MDNRISGCFSYNVAMVSEQRPTKVSKHCTLVGLFLQISYNEATYYLKLTYAISCIRCLYGFFYIRNLGWQENWPTRNEYKNIIVGLCFLTVVKKWKIQQTSGFTGMSVLLKCQYLRKIKFFWNFLKKAVDNVCTWWYYIQVAAVSGNK